MTVLYVPLGHGAGTDVPAGQKCRTGHTEPLHDAAVDASLHNGVGVVAPPVHMYPGEHSPAGATMPESGQYDPGVQRSQASMDVLPVALENVPAGQPMGVADPDGQ